LSKKPRRRRLSSIANTRTSKGLEIIAKLDHSKYETGIKVTDEEFKSIVLKKDDFQGKWNYKIKL